MLSNPVIFVIYAIISTANFVRSGQLLLTLRSIRSQWNNVTDYLDQQLASIQTADEITNLTSSLSDIIQKNYPYNLTVHNQKTIAPFYISTIKKYHHFGMSQHKLIELVQQMMDQNVKLQIELDISVWNQFWAMYYKLNNTYYDNYIFVLLGWMRYPGSNTTATLDTFNIILSGIANCTFVNVQKPERLVDIVNNILKTNKINPNNATYGSQFRVFQKTGNLARMTSLLMDHPDIIFDDVDINLFNKILENLPNYSHHFDKCLPFFMNTIASKYVHFNMETYTILKNFSYRYPEIRNVFKDIKQTNVRHDNVDRIVNRARQIALGMDTIGFRNYDVKVPDELKGTRSEYPKTPDVSAFYSKRTWDTLIRKWRKALHNFDDDQTS